MKLEDVDLEEIYENFEILEDWEQKYMYLIDLGNMIPELDLIYKTQENLVEGCTSKVWVVRTEENGLNHYLADSESQIVKGLVALVLIIFNNKTADEINNTDAESIFKKINLESNLSGNRANGLRAMVERIKLEAKQNGREIKYSIEKRIKN